MNIKNKDEHSMMITKYINYINKNNNHNNNDCKDF